MPAMMMPVMMHAKRVGALLLLAGLPCAGQSGNATEIYGPVSALQVYNSLGTNITSANEWEYQAAQAAHITWGRYDCPWQRVEQQRLPQNVSGGYALPRDCASGLAFSRMYGVHPMVDALYGAPFGRVATATTTADFPVGSTVVSLRTVTGSLSYVVPGQSYLKLGSGNVSSKHAYAGTLITGKDANSVTLASALTADIPAGSTVTLNLQLYAPVLISQGTSYLQNPSIQAYGNYVHFLQTQVAASGIAGRVSIWNEPPWQGDPWDEAANLYDNPPAANRIKSGFGVELAYYASTLPPVPGAALDNGYTNKTGGGSLFEPDRVSNLVSADGVRATFASESFHPYGNNPEDGAWIPACVQTHNTKATLGGVYRDCTPVGMVQGANIKWQAAFNAANGSFRGLDIGITETGLARGISPLASETQITRFDLRQFLVYSGSGVHPILFYRLAGDAHYAWLQADQSPYPVYTAFQNLMADMAMIARPAATPYPSCSLPQVQSRTASFPLAMVTLVGSRAGDRANSLLVYTWQRSYTSGKWVALASPAAANVSLSIPGGLKVAMVKDTVTGATVAFQATGRSVSYPVQDDPVEVMLVPVSSSATQAPCD